MTQNARSWPIIETVFLMPHAGGTKRQNYNKALWHFQDTTIDTIAQTLVIEMIDNLHNGSIGHAGTEFLDEWCVRYDGMADVIEVRRAAKPQSPEAKSDQATRPDSQHTN